MADCVPRLIGIPRIAWALSGGCRFLRSNVAEEAVDRGEPSIAGSNSIAAGGLKVFEKGQHRCRIQAGELESTHAALRTGCCEAQEQHQGVPVGTHGMLAEIATCNQMDPKEVLK